MNINPAIESEKVFSQAMKKCSLVCAVMVIFIHTYNLEVYKICSESVIYWFESFVAKITACAVPFFFMSSSFFLYQKEREVISVYKSRFKSIMIPYLLWNIIYMIAFTILKKLSLTNVGLVSINIIDILKGIFLYKYNYTYWFMFYLILFILLYPAIKQIVCRSKIVCFSVLIALLTIDFGNIINHNIIPSFIYYYLGAICGYYYRKQTEKISTIQPKKKTAIIMMCIVGFVLSVVASIFDINISVVGNVSLILLLLIILSSQQIKMPLFLLGLSFMIYSMHGILLECVEKVIYIAFPHNVLWATIDYFVSPAVTLMIIVVICAAMKKVCPSLYNILNGNRK